MAGASLLALLDDIATILDDVSVMSKVAAKKTAGVLGDDLALNAQQVAGVRAERELPVVWAVARGSLVNKLILVPAALLISAFAPWAVTPLLMLGGAYLCYEGFEKVAHHLLHARGEDARHHHELTEALTHPEVDLVALERDKIRGAIRTDFVLSAEIIVIALGVVADAPLATRAAALAAIGVLMTVGVYGLVGLIVKLDDIGLYLSQRSGSFARGFGRLLLAAAPRLMKTLSVVGTLAMFLVGGGILVHGLAFAHPWVEQLGQAAQAIPIAGGALAYIAPALMNLAAGLAAGALILATTAAGKRLLGQRA
jgi:predicted DNA repair protein MutK